MTELGSCACVLAHPTHILVNLFLVGKKTDITERLALKNVAVETTSWMMMEFC